MTDNTDGPWLELFNYRTTREELERIIEARIKIALEETCAQFDGLGPRDRATARSLIAPVIEAQTRGALTSAWNDLRREAGLDRGGIH